MRTFYKNKLARDKIIEHMESMGAQVCWRYLNDQEYTVALTHKLLEEAQEVKTASLRAELIEELADIYEVIEALKRLHKISEEEIVSAQTKKFDERGGFFERKYLETVAYPEGSYWERYCLANPEKFPEIKGNE